MPAFSSFDAFSVRNSAPLSVHTDTADSGVLERLPLHGVQATRELEQAVALNLPPHTLMQRAGLAIARVALAIAPHAQSVWVACGPGNNGGDGLQAAFWLQKWGKHVMVSTLAPLSAMPADAQAAWRSARDAGVRFVATPPALQASDLCIDALLGIGTSRAPGSAMRHCMAAMRSCPAQVLAVDIPSGLLADTGSWAEDAPGVRADHTIALLTLKPGLFTAHGRDACGQLWWHDLGAAAATPPADAWLQGASLRAAHIGMHGASPVPYNVPAHASHKGSFGDVRIIGGDAGMQGAAILAGEAALYSGAGRVHVELLQPAPVNMACDPSLMLRDACVQNRAAPPSQHAITVCGCGGGRAVARHLPDVLQHAPHLVLDADALNAIAASAPWQTLLRQRARQGMATVLTPHPLEAARLLSCTTAFVQNNRLRAAQELADALQCIVALKGSGSICAWPAAISRSPANPVRPVINHSGNALLATAGTGDVLAGCIGSYWAQARAHLAPTTTDRSWQTAWHACCAAVHAHGCMANGWNACTMRGALSAQRLARLLRRPAPSLWAI